MSRLPPFAISTRLPARIFSSFPTGTLTSVNALEPGDEALVGHMVLVAKELAAQEGVAEHGYRLMINTGVHGGQTVPHLHVHLIAGKLARFLLG